MANALPALSQNVGYAGNTEYQGPIPQYQEQIPQYQGQMPQYPYFMSPSYGPPPTSGSVISSLIHPANMPPPYPPH
jgi:hypothetical protein